MYKTIINICDNETLNKVHSAFCMHTYGCRSKLWNINYSGGENFYVVWRKLKRRI